MRIQAVDLQSALTEASMNLECSVMDLEYEILQHPRKGFLGLGRKKAIIEANVKKRTTKKTAKNDFVYSKNDHLTRYNQSNQNNDIQIKNENTNTQKYFMQNDKIFDSFHCQSEDLRDTQEILDEIRTHLVALLQSSEFKIELKELKMYSADCVLIHLDGEDAALMIGKEAHRYKALSYLLHNWINLKYNFLVRLEIAQFLENQIQGMQFYLQGIIKKIKINGRGQTKPLDGVLIKIALERLRSEFPDKYVGIKQINDQRFVIINDFLKKDE